MKIIANSCAENYNIHANEPGHADTSGYCRRPAIHKVNQPSSLLRTNQAIECDVLSVDHQTNRSLDNTERQRIEGVSGLLDDLSAQTTCAALATQRSGPHTSSHA